MSEIRMHFVIPSVVAAAPHMISGEPSGAIPLARDLREKIGHQGQSYRFACNPRGVTNDVHRATGEPWALLEVISGQVAYSDSACLECVKTKEWIDAYAKWKAENDNRPHPNVRVPEEVITKSGGCC